jgi:hypothetical protein
MMFRQQAALASRPDMWDFRYQLTVIGQFAQAIASREIVNNGFAIKTDQPHVNVSWCRRAHEGDSASYAVTKRMRLDVEPWRRGLLVIDAQIKRGNRASTIERELHGHAAAAELDEAFVRLRLGH